MNIENISEVVQKAREYDSAALTDLCKMFYERIFNYIYYKTRNKADAEDLTSEVFIKMAESINSQNGDFKAWLYKIAQNKVIDYYRHISSRKENLLDYEISKIGEKKFEPDDPFIKENIKNAITKLTEEQQDVIILRFAESYKISEIAEILDKSVEAVKSLQFRAVESLKKILSVKSEVAINGRQY